MDLVALFIDQGSIASEQRSIDSASFAFSTIGLWMVAPNGAKFAR